MIRKWTKSAGILFLAVSAVYSTRATFAQTVGADSAKKDAANVRLLDEAADPVPTTQPTTQPDKALKPAGQSVSASQVNVSDAGTVEIHVNDASLVEVLRMLSLQSQKNIIASKDVHGTVTANLYDVTVREALDAILKANGYDYREKGNFIFVYTAKEIADMEKAARAKKTEVFRLFYTPAANAVNMLKPVLSTEGQVAFTTPAVAGIGSNAGTSAGVGSAAALSDTGGNSHATEDVIVVTDYPENLDAARKVLKELDRRPVQVLIEATILRATLSDNNALGIDFTALGGVDFSTLGGLVGAASSSTGSTGGTGSTGSSGSTGSGSSGTPKGPGGFPNGLGNAYNNGILSTPGAGGINNKGFVAGSVGGNGLQLGLVKDSVALFINALEGVTDTTVLANPKVLVLNKQVGEVHVGSELGYRTATVTETSTADTINFLETGTRLVFRPYVGEGGYIRLEIHPEDSSGSVDSSGLPSKAVTQVTSNILVKDGHTIVIGGLFREATTRSRSQVPFLGSLPGVGLLFRNQADSTVREEDIILLTPHIIKDDDAYSEASEEQAKEADRIRVGMRRGLMPWGRERLAESWYQNAVNEMNKPHPNRNNALFNLNCAIYLNPKFVEALDLRSQIQGHDAEATDNSSIRYFVRDQILAERARGATTMPSEPSAVPITPSSKADEKLPQKAKPAMHEQADADDATGAAPTNQPSETQTAKAPTTQPTDQPTAEAPVDPITDTPDPIDDSMPNNEDAKPNGDEQSTPEVQQPQEQDENATPEQPKKDQGD